MAADWSFVTAFEFGQLDGPFGNPEVSSSGPPVSSTIETANPAPGSGARYLELVLAANDGHRFREIGESYARATVGEGVTVAALVYISDDTDWDTANGRPIRMAATCDGDSTENSTVGVEISPVTGQVRIYQDDQETPSGQTHDQVLATFPAGTIPSGDWVDVELYVEFVDGATGRIALGVNGAVILDESTHDTWGTATVGNPAVGYGWLLEFTDPNVSRTCRVDHVRIGHGHGGLLGRKYVEGRAVDGTAAEDDPTAVGAASNREALDEIPVNTADYADFTTAGNRFRCGVAARSHTGDIDAITLVAAGSVPTGAATLIPIVEEGATETDGPAMVLTATPGTRYRQGPLANNPRTGLPWTGADYTAMTVGARRSA